ncbi:MULTISPECIES: hypothetical protein [unclassified Mesorhizobium]|uniref:hypothetical protein n=1 Tax=unclassified Mesorhizobium TaxID=325217 RepID=UPI000BAF2628|nr:MULTISPECIES: hypothetical protein [unclassified Mesorhizobium]PBC21284.1 hypothetical protein CK226_20850 [Mesorhizobium sp. WSM4311]TRD04788.1 hypothetical protein FJV82_13095 [Mesorhizobium sp. WSM4305]
MKLLDLGADFRDVTGYAGRAYYRLATITWSEPLVWHPDDRSFPVPVGWAGHGGVYAFTRKHWRQQGRARIAYIGKAISFKGRLINTHDHFDIVKRRGDTMVSCGRIAFERVRSRPGYYLEIEDIIKFAVYAHLENTQGFESLPGFRISKPTAMVPWVITNEGHRFGGIMPRRIVYPAIGIEYRTRS